MYVSPSITITHVDEQAPRVTQHDVTFLFRLKEEPNYKTLQSADEDMLNSFCGLISGGTYKEGGETYETLEGCQPEPESDSESEAEATLYSITWFASREIPLHKADQTKAFNLSVESLLEEAPGVIAGIYAKHGIELEYVRAEQYVVAERRVHSRVSLD